MVLFTSPIYIYEVYRNGPILVEPLNFSPSPVEIWRPVFVRVYTTGQFYLQVKIQQCYIDSWFVAVSKIVPPKKKKEKKVTPRGHLTTWYQYTINTIHRIPII